MYLSDRTRVALGLAGSLLTEDVLEAEARMVAGKEPAEAAFLVAARTVLRIIDEIDDQDDPQKTTDWLLYGEAWLECAEAGLMKGDYVPHVLAQATGGRVGYLGPPFVRLLLSAIDAADAQNRELLLLSHPEYAGLWLALCHVPGAVARLEAVLGG